MKKSKGNKAIQKTLLLSSQKERKERITNGTWMGRNTVFKSKKAYNRKGKSKITIQEW